MCIAGVAHGLLQYFSWERMKSYSTHDSVICYKIVWVLEHGASSPQHVVLKVDCYAVCLHHQLHQMS